MNTKVHYRYRDESNCKRSSTVVLPGAVADDDVEPLLDEGTYFLPESCGLPHLGDSWPAHYNFPVETVDHPWHELDELEATDDPPTLELTAQQFLERLRDDCLAGWPLADGWREAKLTPAARLPAIDGLALPAAPAMDWASNN